jgi:hypothetical protein
MAQPHGLAALLRRLKARDMHTVVYTGFTLETLARRTPSTDNRIPGCIECGWGTEHPSQRRAYGQLYARAEETSDVS